MEFVLFILLVTTFVPENAVTTADIEEKLKSVEQVFDSKLKHVETRVTKLENEVTILKHEKNSMSDFLVRSLRSKSKYMYSVCL